MSKIVKPVAQSFFIEDSCIVTKVDLFFAQKDYDRPVTLHIRQNENGIPGKYIIPMSEVIVYPDFIYTSSKGETPTEFKFDNPIFLKPGEYSLCIGSDSSNYNLYVSELDNVDLITGKRVTIQPTVGSLYKSQNASTWTPEQLLDLKFNLYRALFDPTNAATIDFTLRGAPPKTLESDPLEIYNGSTTMRVYHFNHGMPNGSFVTLRAIGGATADLDGSYNTLYNIDMAQIVGVPLEIADQTLYGYTVTLPTAASASLRFGGSGVVATQNIVANALYPVMAKIEEAGTQIDVSYRGTNVDYTIDNAYQSLEKATNELEKTKLIVSDTVKVNNLSNNDDLDYRLTLSTNSVLLAPMIDTTQFGLVAAQNIVNSPTYASEVTLTEDLISFMSAESGVTVTVSSDDSTAGTISVPSGLRELALTLTVGSYMNITSTAGANDGQSRIVSISDDGSEIEISKLSGNISTETSAYTITVGANYVAEEAATGGSTYSKYITRQVDFANPSTAFNLRLDINRPVGSGIDIYYKTKLVGESAGLSNKEFVKISIPNMPTTLDTNFIEIEKQVDDLQPYESIVFKIVFTSNDGSTIPKCRNLRIIALA